VLTETTPINPYHSMPKVELHRHLEGSLRLVTLVEIAREHGVSVPDNVLNMSERVQVQDGISSKNSKPCASSIGHLRLSIA